MANSSHEYNAIAWLCCMIVWVYYQIGMSLLYVDREPVRNRDGERNQILGRMYTESDANCHDLLRMNRVMFNRLCQRLVGVGLRESRFVGVREKVAMFLLTIGRDTRMRHSAFGFIRSSETIHRHFHSVLNAILRLGREVIRPATADFSPLMAANTRSWAMTYFKDCVSAIDGTFMPAMVPIDDQPRYRNRKGDIRHNVLAACSFDMKFTYILAGWEGSAHDSRLLRSALTRVRDKLFVPSGKYYLADAGFPHARGFMAPYRGTRYHLNDIRGRTPASPKELFNYRHSSLRNVIERTFGLLKKRFAYLRTTPFYNVDTQIKLIIACCILHNIIRDEDPDDLGTEWRDPMEEEHDDLADGGEDVATLQPSDGWTGFRNTIAENMWNNYRGRQG
ncbi:hypothetical protein ACHQM5_024289 [Ranunculus cassubicifolius]